MLTAKKVTPDDILKVAKERTQQNNYNLEKPNFQRLSKEDKKQAIRLSGKTAMRASNAMKMIDNPKYEEQDKNELMKEHEEQQKKEKEEFNRQRLRVSNSMKLTHRKGVNKNIILPVYQMDKRLKLKREVNPPHEGMFIGLGWDPEPDEEQVRHYRKFYPDELEQVTEIMETPSPFNKYDLHKGQKRGAGHNWFAVGTKKEKDTTKYMGKFKGIVSVFNHEIKAHHDRKKAGLKKKMKEMLNDISQVTLARPFELDEEKLETQEGRQKLRAQLEEFGAHKLTIVSKLAHQDYLENIKRLLLTTTSCTVRIYIICAYDLASRDNGSASDPYLKLKLGKKKVNDRKNYQEDEPNPDFNKHFDFNADFPGCPPLVLQVFDYNMLFGDQLIGESYIDLEDRFFSPDW